MKGLDGGDELRYARVGAPPDGLASDEPDEHLDEIEA
jgi:hypothetical protein